MDNEVKEALAGFIKKCTETLGESKEFVVEQAPDVVQQFLVAEAISHSIWTGMMLLIIVLLLVTMSIFVKRGNMHLKAETDEDLEGSITKLPEEDAQCLKNIPLVFCSLSSLGMFVLMLYYHTVPLIILNIAPKWYVVEEMSKLVQ